MNNEHGGTVIKVIIGVLVAFAILIGGCTALLGTAVNEASKEIDKEQNKSAITQAQFDSIKTGSTRASVESKLGEPKDAQETEIDTSSFEGKGKTQQEDCIYYNVKGGELLDMYQLCFSNQKLSSKSKF